MNRRTLTLFAAALLGVVAANAQATGPYSVVKKTKVGGAGGFDYVNADEAGRRLFIARSGMGARISVFNLDTLVSEGEIQDVAARGVAPEQAVTDGKGHIYIDIEDKDNIAVVDAKTMEAFSSNGDGTLTIIQETSPTSFAVEQTLDTMPGAKTMALDNKTGRILLISAEYGPAPAPAQPGGRAGRGPLVDGSFTILTVAR